MRKSYTRTGDEGMTGRLGGRRLSKASALIDTLGALDEANTAIGLARAVLRHNASTRNGKRIGTNIDGTLREIQDILFRVGADVSTSFDSAQGKPPVKPLSPRITDEDTKKLETKIDVLDTELPELAKFILPAGTEVAATLHLARAILRRAERSFVAAGKEENLNAALGPFLNRLSSYLFALARFVNHTAGHEEEHPRYTNGTSE